MKHLSTFFLIALILGVSILSFTPFSSYAVSPSVVQWKSGCSGSGTQTSCTLAFASSLTAGNVLVVFAQSYDTGTTCYAPSVSDSLGNTFTQVQSTNQAGTGSGCPYLKTYLVNSTKAGSDTVTISVGTAVYIDLFMIEISGVYSSGYLTSTGKAQCSGNCGQLSVTSFAQNNGITIAVASFGNTGAGTMTYSSGWTGYGVNAAFEYLLNPSGNTNAYMTYSTSAYAWVENAISLTQNPPTITDTVTEIAFNAPTTAIMGIGILFVLMMLIPWAVFAELGKHLPHAYSFMSAFGLLLGSIFGVIVNAIPNFTLLASGSVFIMFVWRSRRSPQNG